MANLRVRIRVDQKELIKHKHIFPSTLKRESRRALINSANYVMKQALNYAPEDTGDLKKGLMHGRPRFGKTIDSVSIEWREVNERRKRSFQANKWKRFIDWMHDSPYSLKKFPWRTGFPNFLDLAALKGRIDLEKNMLNAVDIATKRS